MADDIDMLLLNTGLFPGGETVERALDGSAGAARVKKIDLAGLPPEDDQAWLAVADAILGARAIVTR